MYCESMSSRHILLSVLGAVLIGAFAGSPPAAAATGELTFVEQHTSTALDFARGVTVSPDGENVYVAGQNADAVMSYSRATSGALTELGCVEDDAAPVATSCTASGDGLNSARFIAVFDNDVYVSAGDDDAVAVFSRGTGGELVPDGCVESTGGASATCTDLLSTTNVLNGAEGIAVSPDGKQVYVAGQDNSQLVTLTRNITTGALTFAASTGTGLANPRELAISPDGKGVYVASASGNAIAAFLRDPSTGSLTAAGTTGGVNLPVGVAVSPDSKHVYAGAVNSSAVRAYTRDPNTSVLTQGGCLKDPASVAAGCTDAAGLGGVEGVAVSPDGQSVYAAGASGSAVVAMTRQPLTGALGSLACIRDVGAAGGGCTSANGLGSAHGVAVSPDDRNVYVTGQSDDAVVVLDRAQAGSTPDPTPTPDPRCSDPTIILVTCGIDPKMVVCVGLWVGSCNGKLPPPSPVQTCVSLWQDCNGFGGSKPKRPPQIDLSGLPTSVKVKVGCDETAKNPFKKEVARVSETPTKLRDDVECLLKTHWEGTDPNSDAKLDYQINLERFKTEVDAVAAEEKQGAFLGCAGVDLCDPRATKALPLVLSNLLDNIFAAAKKSGAPVPVRSSYIDLQVIDRLCEGGTAIPPGRSDFKPTAAGCRQLFITLDESIRASMNFLRDRKKLLGVDRPFSNSGKKSEASAAKARSRSKMIIFGGGQVSIKQGRKANLRIKIPRKVRTLMRKARREGNRSITVTAVTRATIVPGVTSTKRVKVILKLRR